MSCRTTSRYIACSSAGKALKMRPTSPGSPWHLELSRSIVAEGRQHHPLRLLDKKAVDEQREQRSDDVVGAHERQAGQELHGWMGASLSGVSGYCSV